MSKKTKKGRRGGAAKGRAALPTVSAILMCDAIASDPTTGKSTLYGVFDRIAIAEDGQNSRFAVFAKLWGGSGRPSIGFEVVGPDESSRPLIPSQQQQLVELSPDATFEAGVLVAGFKFEQVGKHSVFMTADGKRVGSPCRLDVVKSKPKQGAK